MPLPVACTLRAMSIITDATLLPKDALVCDIVYNPLKTKLLALAEAASCQILDGLGMFGAPGCHCL